MPFLSLLLASMAPATCPAERGIYTMKEAPGFELSLPKTGNNVSVASNLYVRLAVPPQDGQPRQTIWFILTSSNGYGTTALVPVHDPATVEDGSPVFINNDPDDDDAVVTTRFIAFDAELNPIDTPPSQGTAAPAYILLPDAGPSLWYNAGSFLKSDPQRGFPQITMPTAMFRLSGCAR